MIFLPVTENVFVLALASHPEIKNSGVLLLAPTGKARVHIEQMAKGLGVSASTLAQYLNRKSRFNGASQRYVFLYQIDEAYDTVILDEASMLTEEMLATTLDYLKKAKRFILVGNHFQLPPIGAGRPFVDIIERVRPEGVQQTFPKVGSNYAELSVNMRTIDVNRLDLQLAEWFSGNELEVGADSVINEVLTKSENEYLKTVKWNNDDDFEKVFESVLVEVLGLDSGDYIEGFNKKLGSSDGKFFNNSGAANYFKNAPSVDQVEAWQILSPVRARARGITNLNSRIHEWFRSKTVKYAAEGRKVKIQNGYEFTERKLPKPVLHRFILCFVIC